MNSIEAKKQTKVLKLTKRQRAILVGTLLGDAHLETQNDGRTYRLKIEHSVGQQEYVWWLYKEFKEWVVGKPYTKERSDGRKSIGFTTRAHASFRFYGHQFYDGSKKKVVPKLIHKWLVPLGVAVWYLDDGSKKSKQHITYNIHTLAFSKRELERLQEALHQYSIATSLHKQGKVMWRIYVRSASAAHFKKMLLQHVGHLDTMQYKIG